MLDGPDRRASYGTDWRTVLGGAAKVVVGWVVQVVGVRHVTARKDKTTWPVHVTSKSMAHASRAWVEGNVKQ